MSLVLFGAALVLTDAPLVGDEPHYALEAISLADDHNADLSREYDDAALIQEVYGATTLEPHAFQFPGGHGLQSVHGIGLPLLLVPAALVTHSPFWMRATVVLIAAIGAALLMVLLERVAFGRTWERWAAWTAVVLSAPLLIYSGELYPEIPAATVVLGAAVLLTRPRLGPTTMAVVGLLAGALPWLNVRFLALSLGIMLIGLWRCWNSSRRVSLVVALMAPVLISGIATAAVFQHWYGSWSPTAQYALSDSPRTWVGTYRNAVGTIIGRSFGWLPAAPVHLIGLLGIGVLVTRLRRSALAGVLAAALYVVVVCAAGVGFGGGTFPGRLLVAVIPLIAIPLLIVLATQRWWWRASFFVLGLLTLALTAHAVATDASATAPPRDSWVGRYERIWPDSSGRSQAQVIWDGVPTRLTGNVGQPSSDTPPGRGVLGSRSAPAGTPGVLLRGTTPRFPASSYTAGIHLRADAATTGDIATLEVRDEHGNVDFSRTVSSNALPPEVGWRAFALPYHTPEAQRMTFTVRTTGAVRVWAGAPQIHNNPGATQAGQHGYPALGTTLAWLIVLIAAAVTAVVYDRRHYTGRSTFS